MNKVINYLREKRWWRLIIFFVFASIVVLLYLRSKGFAWIDWTGFEGKTLWDLWNLFLPLIITLVIAALAQKLTLENQRENILQNYFDAITKLILDKNLKGSEPNSEVREIARVKTLTALKSLDGKRKGTLIKFLSATNLIQKVKKNGSNYQSGVG